MESVLEAHDALAAGEMPRHLHRILHRLGAAIQEKRALRLIARRDAVEALGQLYVGLVGGYRKADVGVAVELGANGGDDRGMPVSGIDHPDASTEIDEPIAVRIGDDRAFGVSDGDGGDRRHASGDGFGPPRQQRATGRAGDFGLEKNDAGHVASAGTGDGATDCCGELIAAWCKK